MDIFDVEFGVAPNMVAEKYAAARPGFRLADFAEAGLPIYRLTVQALLLDHKKIPPIEEYILRALEAGLNAAEEISKFLGLEMNIVNGALAELMRTDHIYLAAPPGDRNQVLALTLIGRRSLTDAKLVVPEERSLEIEFDGLLRKPVPAAPSDIVMKPQELNEKGMLEIPPFPPQRPELEDLDLQLVGEIVRQKGTITTSQKHLLAIKSLDRRQRFFVPAVALIYKSNHGDEIQVAFAIEGRLSEEHERAFAQGNGAVRLGITKTLHPNYPEEVSSLLEAGSAQAPSLENLEAIKKATLAAQEELQDLQVRVQETESKEEKEEALRQIGEATERLRESKAALETFEVRPLDVYEHKPLLEKAILESHKRLLIISPWIKAAVVNKRFVVEFEKMLERGVRAFVGYGISQNEDKNQLASDIRAEQDLRNLSEKYENFSFKKLGDTHAKILIMDSEFVVITSFNWLSFRGDSNRTFRDEKGVYVSIPGTIEDVFGRYHPRFSTE